MPKRRTPKSTISQEKIEAFTSAVDGQTETPFLDPNAPRQYKTISVPFNEYEFKQLEQAIQKTNRTKLNFIRWAMLEKSKEVNTD